MSKRKRDGTVKDDFEAGLLEELDAVLSVYETNVTPLIGFFDDGRWRRLVQAWSYHSQVSNHNKLSLVTSRIAKVVECCDKNTSLVRYGSMMVRDILESHLKIIYRCLFIGRPAIANPALRLLTDICTFHKGVLTTDLFSALDLSLKAIPKILSTKETRPQFIKFYLAFISNGSVHVKRDLISQRKVISGWFKQLNEDDEWLASKTVDVLKNHIVLDPSISKTSKVHFFTDWMMACLIKLFTRTDSVPAKAEELLRLLCTDAERGVRFPDKTWYNETVQNKLLLSVLRMLKPWDDVLQQNLAIDIMQASPELVAGYIKSLADSISYDPKLSSFWVSFSTFYSRIIRIPMPELKLQAPPVSVVLENVLPQTLSKVSLSKSLTHEVAMIRYFSAEILVHSLSKLDRLVAVYEQNKWDANELMTLVLARLPDVQILSTCLSTLQDGPILKSVVMLLVALFSKLFPEALIATKLTLPSEHLQHLQNAKGLELVQAQSTLTVQARVNKAGKWYNKSGKYSLFTNLLRLGTLNPALKQQALDLVIDLTRPTLLFQLETLAHPLEALIVSLDTVKTMSSDEQEKLWTLLDESVARCARSPYKYVDEFAQMRVDGVVSPFVFTVVEQYQYVKDPQCVKDWLCKFLSGIKIAGENAAAVDKFRGAGIDVTVEHILDREVSTTLQLAAVKYSVLQKPELASDLFATVSSHIASTFASPLFFQGLLRQPISKAYFETLYQFRSIVDTEKIKQAVVELPDNVKCDALWLGVEMNDKVTTNGHVFAQRVNQKSAERQLVDLTDFEQFDGLQSDISEAQSAMVRNINVASAMAELNIDQQRYEWAVCAFIQATGRAPSTVDTIAVAATTLKHSDVSNDQLLHLVPSAVDTLDENSFVVLSKMASSLDAGALDKLSDIVANLKGNIAISDAVTQFAGCVATLRPTQIKTWTRNVVSWLIQALDSPSATALEFASVFSRFVSSVDIWSLVPNSVEILANKLVQHLTPESVGLLTSLAYNPHSKPLAKLLSQVIEKVEDVDTNMALLIWKLFMLDPKQNGTEVLQDKLLVLCGCTSRAADVLLLNLVKRIEARLYTSWVNRVFTWAITADDYSRVFTQTADGMVVRLNANIIKRSASDFNPEAVLELEPTGSLEECRSKVHYYSSCFVADEPSYDSEFLLMSVLASPELFRDNSTVDIKLFVESGCLSFVVACLAHGTLGQASRVIVEAVLHYMVNAPEGEITYRDKLAVEVLLKKILTVLQDDDKLEPCVWSMLAQLVPVFCNPGHFMYIRAIEFLFAGPTVLNDLPLYKDVTTSCDDDDQSRQYSWLLDALTCACQTTKDVALYQKRGVVEWALNLNQSCYMHVDFKVKKLVGRMQERPQGSTTLVTRHGALSWVEKLGKPVDRAKLGARFALTVDREKLQQWTGGDLGAFVKRIQP